MSRGTDDMAVCKPGGICSGNDLADMHPRGKFHIDHKQYSSADCPRDIVYAQKNAKHKS